jgi:hypothetical protein
MSKLLATTPLGISLGMGFAVCLAASPLANAGENPFGVVSFDASHPAATEGACGGHGKEGGCGAMGGDDDGDKGAGDEDASDD